MQSYPLSTHLGIRALFLVLATICICSGCVNDQELEFNPVLDIEPTCSDGFKNQDETAIDCGGACSNFCGDSFLAACSGELEQNFVSSPTDDLDLEIIKVYTEKNYYSNNCQVIGYAGTYSSDDQIRVHLPIKDFPAGNREFKVAESLDTDPENLRARVEIDPQYGSSRISRTGTLYVRVENKETIHIEFCDILFYTSDYYNSGYHKYQGNLHFQIADSNN